MKAAAYLAPLVAAAVLLTACQKTPDTPPDNPLGMYLSVSEVTDTGLTLTFTQSGGKVTGSLDMGSIYWVEQQTGEGWEQLPEEPAAYTLQGYTFPLEDSVSFPLDWTNRYGALDPGSYRIGIEIIDLRAPGDYDEYNTYAPFEINS